LGQQRIDSLARNGTASGTRYHPGCAQSQSLEASRNQDQFAALGSAEDEPVHDLAVSQEPTVDEAVLVASFDRGKDRRHPERSQLGAA